MNVNRQQKCVGYSAYIKRHVAWQVAWRESNKTVKILRYLVIDQHKVIFQSAGIYAVLFTLWISFPQILQLSN